MISLMRRHPFLVIFVSLALLNAILYLPAVNAYFISDDFAILSTLHSHLPALLNGRQWEEWLGKGVTGYVYFRPVAYLFLLTDFLAWNGWPVGYHLANLILHVLCSFQAFLLCSQLVRNKAVGILAAALFAAMPVHAEAVSWIAAIPDLLAGFFCLMSLTSYVLYLRRNSPKFYVTSVAAFALALSSKETAITLPAVILLYDALFDLKRLTHVLDSIKRHAPFWLIVAMRLTLWQVGYRGPQVISEGYKYWFDASLDSLLKPFLTDITGTTTWLVVGLAVLAFLLNRSRAIVFALLWIPIALLPTITNGPSDRSSYIPALGLSLAFAILLAQLAGQPNRVIRGVGWGTALVLLFWSGEALLSLNLAYNRAGQVAYAIPQQVKSLHPSMPDGAHLVFVGVPDQVPEGPLVYITGFEDSLRLAYNNPSLAVSKVGKFPLVLDGLDRTHFFSVDHRRVWERTDLTAALSERRQCSGFSMPTSTWDFSRDTQGWEAWNQLSDFGARDGALHAQSDGSDPYMASPPIDIPAIAMGDVEVTMRVRSRHPEMHGSVYWLATGQNDFSPALQASFAVRPGEEFRTYRVDPAQTKGLLLGDRILRLRLDPVDDTAQIDIKEVRVYLHCTGESTVSCQCPSQIGGF
ncbi:MAG: glycosyltransferase family 39 protein [Chloroflexi bacterium]|nr:glycosyltransferase family 39 protein [Chloroflexota bacterium]